MDVVDAEFTSVHIHPAPMNVITSNECLDHAIVKDPTNHKVEPYLELTPEEVANLAALFANSLVREFSYGRPVMDKLWKYIMTISFKGNIHIGLLDYRHLKNGNSGFWQHIEYEDIRNYCFHCWKIGHNEENCRALNEDKFMPRKKWLPKKGVETFEVVKEINKSTLVASTDKSAFGLNATTSMDLVSSSTVAVILNSVASAMTAV
ncbi:hypothetical protein K2173_015461 [Erythroxylum novogranatense]|uniref:CCHC-type domain-containing protein n=1 Tax=Erythroxylum novogranatense TaxID=1862640 RepID=A0AAV8SSW8_9ROSI|nr:hypothetical protein K2173_015461 [Erythroxylum novogranatense]